MELIDTEQRARRLARAVATDIVLYNEKQISAGADLSREIAEGRSHFCARVTPSLHWIFEEVLAATPLGKGTPSSEPRVEPPRVEPPRVEAPRVEAPRIETTAAQPSSRPAPAAASSPDPSAGRVNVEAPPVEPEPPAAPSSAAPSKRAEPETEPAPPESAPAPHSVPVEKPITPHAAVAEPRSSAAGPVVVLLCVLALVLVVSWFVVR